jgi:hypothetical protein
VRSSNLTKDFCGDAVFCLPVYFPFHVTDSDVESDSVCLAQISVTTNRVLQSR